MATDVGPRWALFGPRARGGNKNALGPLPEVMRAGHGGMDFL
jgi:hypothetical protein